MADLFLKCPVPLLDSCFLERCLPGHHIGLDDTFSGCNPALPAAPSFKKTASETCTQAGFKLTLLLAPNSQVLGLQGCTTMPGSCPFILMLSCPSIGLSVVVDSRFPFCNAACLARALRGQGLGRNLSVCLSCAL
jgi:hypothetical protein